MAWPFLFAEPDFDPVLGAVPTTLTVLTSSNIRLMGLVFTNSSGLNRTVTVTDTAGNAILNAVDISPTGVPFIIELPFCKLLGLKWVASNTGVIGKPWGYIV